MSPLITIRNVFNSEIKNVFLYWKMNYDNQVEWNESFFFRRVTWRRKEKSVRDWSIRNESSSSCPHFKRHETEFNMPNRKRMKTQVFRHSTKIHLARSSRYRQSQTMLEKKDNVSIVLIISQKMFFFPQIKKKILLEVESLSSTLLCWKYSTSFDLHCRRELEKFLESYWDRLGEHRLK